MEVAAYGVQRTYIRATIGLVGIDARFEQNAAQAVSAGLGLGFYHLLYPDLSGTDQALHFLRQTQTYLLALPLAVDVEEILERVATPERAAKVLYDFVQAVARAGKELAIYTGRWYWDVAIASDYDAYFSTLKLWVAQYGVEKPVKLPRGWSTYWLHQFSSSGSVPGIQGRVDLNRLRS